MIAPLRINALIYSADLSLLHINHRLNNECMIEQGMQHIPSVVIDRDVMGLYMQPCNESSSKIKNGRGRLCEQSHYNA